ncbi:MAG: FG-GAP repeat protein [Candidatus Krumholzibacteriota bacterium]|nr:FG-GAP repeat protein [Candidatus Krumholzibacteriota bacterium]
MRRRRLSGGIFLSLIISIASFLLSSQAMAQFPYFSSGSQSLDRIDPHGGKIGIYRDPAGTDCDSELALYQIDTLYVVYHPEDNTEGIWACEFRVERTSPNLYIIGTEWEGNLWMGDIDTGFMMSFSDCQGKLGGPVLIGMIRVIPLALDSPNIVKIMPCPENSNPRIAICDENRSEMPVLGGSFTYNGSCTPELVSADQVAANQVELLFTEELYPSSAEDVSNYLVFETLDPSTTIPVAAASLQSDSMSVLLTLAAPLVAGTGYTVQVDNVEDSEGNPIVSGNIMNITGFDVAPPETQITAGPSEGSTISTSNVTFEWTGSDDHTATGDLEYSYQLDGEGYSAFSGGTSRQYVGLSNGSHLFEVKARDEVLNEDQTPAARSFTVNVTSDNIWYVPSEAPTIQAGIDSASAGDTVFVDAGTYFEHDITLKSGIDIIGATGDPTDVNIDAQGFGRVFYANGISDALIKGFTLKNGSSSAGGCIYLLISQINLEDCIISGNTATDGGGIYSLISGVTLLSTTIEGNTASDQGGGIYAAIPYSSWGINLNNCTVADNEAPDGAGIYLGDGIVSTIDHTIIAFNKTGSAAGYDGTPSVTLTCCDVYGNDAGDWTGCLTGQDGAGGNLSIDPVFCADDNPSEPWTLRVDSPCRPDNPGCGQIGAWGVGCSAVEAVEITADMVINTPAVSDLFAGALGSAGDFNGDGAPDIIIGAQTGRNLSNATSGVAYIYYGGQLFTDQPGLVLYGESSGDRFGSSVASAGDINNDGYDDVIVGAYGRNTERGCAYVFFGGNEPDNTVDLIVIGNVTGDRFGISVASAGDVNDDNYGDIIIGASGAGDDGEAYIYFGGSSVDNLKDVVMSIDGPGSDNLFGCSVSGAGDVNGDGIDDVIVGAGMYGEDRGRAYVFLGGTIMDPLADVVIDGSDDGDRFGTCVSSAGDVNGDGYSDVIVGAYWKNVEDGAAYIFLGGSVMDATADVSIIPPVANGWFGYSVASAGDIDDDGYCDIMVGAPNVVDDFVYQGKTFIYRGSPVPDGNVDLIASGSAQNEQSGWCVSSIGDIDDDGSDEFIIGTRVQKAGLYNVEIDDITPPVIVITSGPEEGSSQIETSADFTWIATDNFTPQDSILYAYQLDSGGLSGWGEVTSITLSGLSEGFHLFEVRARDTEDNIGIAERNFAVDFSPPETQITSGPNDEGWTNLTSVTFGWTGSDNIAPPEALLYSYSLDSSEFSDWSSDNTVTYDGLSEGTHVFMVKGKDPLGHEEATPDTVVFQVDTVAPQTVITSGPEAGSLVTSSSVTLTWSGSDDKSGTEDLQYSYRVDAMPYSAFTPDTTHTFAGFTDGPHMISVKARDLAGNEDATPDTLSFTIDAQPPVIVIEEGPDEGQHLSGVDVSFEWRASDDISPEDSILYSYRIDSDGFCDWGRDSTAAYYGLDEGIHTFDIRAKDERGNAGALTRIFTIDITSPGTQVTGGPEDGSCWPSSSVSFTWTGLDEYTSVNALQYRYRLDGAIYTIWSTGTGCSYTSLTQGSHMFEVQARDLAGNIDASPDTVLFSVGYNDLVITEITVPDSAFCNSEIGASWITSNIGDCEVQGSWSDRVYLSPDSAVGGDVLLGNVSVSGPLGPGQSTEVSGSLLLPDNITGRYWLVVVADGAAGVSEEGHEGNNAMISNSFMISIPPHPDLRVTDISVPAEGMSGQGVYIEWTVRNEGDAPSTGGWTEHIYLSDDQVAGGDIKLSEFNYNYSLDVDSSYTHIHPITFPEDIEGGRWIVVVTDAEDEVSEYEWEGNNTAVSDDSIAITMTPYPDLVVSSIELPDSTDTNTEIEISWDVTNQGGAATTTPVWYDKVYLSPNPSLQGAYLLGEYENMSYLGPQESYSQQNRPVMIPKEIPGGIYYIVVVADNRDYVDEHNEEGNNITVSDHIVVRYIEYPRPDLAVTNFVPALTGWAGNPVTVRWTVTNIGDESTGAAAPVDWVMICPDSIVDPHNSIHIGGDIPGQPLEPDSSYTTIRTITLPSNLSGTRYIFVWTDVDLSFDDPELLNNFSDVYPIIINSPSPADLVVSNISTASDTVTAGATLEIEWEVTNEGAGPTSASGWTDAIYISVDDSLVTGTDLNLKRVYHSGYLNPGGIYSRSYTVDIPSGITGLYYLFVYTDIDDVVEEDIFENNNSLRYMIPIEIVEPVQPVLAESDLRIIGAGVSGEAWSGSTAEIVWTVKNFGPDQTSATGWYDYVYLSTDSLPGNGDDQLLLSAQRSAALVINQTYSKSMNISIANGLSGDYYLLVVTDATGKVYEPGAEDNNIAVVPFVINLTPPPDLQVTELLPETQMTSGEQAAVQWTVSNLGSGGTVSTSWTDRVYLSSDSTYNSGVDTQIGIFSHNGALGAGQFYQSNRSVTIPEGYEGDYYILVLADAGGNVYEHGNEDNNMRSAHVTISTIPPDPPPDLAMTTLGFIDGVKDTLSYTVTNESDYGVPSGERSWLDRFYLSPDSTLETSTDILIVSYSRVGDLAPLSSYSRTNEISLPEGTEGEYYIIGITDAGEAVTEETEENNTAFIFREIVMTPPDLTVAGVDCDQDSVIAGQPAIITWTVSNEGTGPCDPESWYDGVYLSIDRMLDETDYLLGTRYHSGGLASGASYPASRQVTIPSGISGNYYFFVETDRNDNVYEYVHEDNNMAYDPDPIHIYIPPPDADLIVSGVTIPPSGVVGDSITIIWTVINESEFDLEGQWRDAVYISPDTSWSLGDIYLGELLHSSGLQAGGLVRLSFTIATSDYLSAIESSVPGLLPGGYYALVRSDIRNNIHEADETNNTGYSQDDIDIDLQTLSLGVTHQSIIKYSEQQFYRLGASGGNDLRFYTECLGQNDELVMFIKYGEVPDRIDYEYRFELIGSQEHIIPGCDTLVCYLMVYGDYVPGGGSYSIRPESFLFELTDIEPVVVDNTGLVTFSITGGHLSDAVSVKLRPLAGESVEAWDIYSINSTRVEAGFDLRGAAIGQYDVVLTTAAPDSAELLGSVTVVDGVGPVIQPYIKGATAIRQNVRTNYDIALMNLGRSDGHDIISSVTVDAGSMYSFGVDGMMRLPIVSDGEPFLVYTSFTGAGSSSDFTISIWGMADFSIEVISVYSEPEFRGAEQNRSLISAWADDAADAFVERLEYDGVIVDPDTFDLLFTEAWNEERLYSEGSTITELVSDRIDETILSAASALGSPEVPTQETGITALGLIAADEKVNDFYVSAKDDDKFKKKKTNVTVRIARDPNEKLGPTMPEEENFVSQLVDLPYTIYFENVPDAQAAAQQVVITDQLDENLDWRKFRLGDIVYSDQVVAVPANLSYYYTTLELESGYLLEINAGINTMTGIAHWIFNTIDPATGLPPIDPDAGFLPPNDENGIGEGHVYFTVRPDSDVPDGAEITNSALIVFDDNDAIETNEILNVIRREFPDLYIASSSGYSAFTSFVEGEEVRVRAVITNLGEAPAENFMVHFFNGDPELGGALIGSPVPVARLASGEEKEVEIVWISQRQLGQYGIYIRVDHNGSVIETDEENNERVFIVDVEEKTYYVEYAQDINLVALPLEPSSEYTARSYADLLGASQIIRYDTAGCFETFIPSEQTGDGFFIDNTRGYIAVLDQAAEVAYTGITHLPQIIVDEGMNIVSLPVDPAEPFNARSFCDRLGSDLLIRYDFTGGRWNAFIPDFDSGDGFGILGARGYIAFCEKDDTLSFTGSGWIGSQQLPVGGYIPTENENQVAGAPLLGVTGSLSTMIWGEKKSLDPGCTVRIRNSRTNIDVPVRVDFERGEFSAVLIDLENRGDILQGDILKVRVLGSSGREICEPFEYTIKDNDIKKRYAYFDALFEGGMPSVTKLYQNFPNPFNPITTIRFQTSARGRVKLKIYNVAGQLIRTLVDEQREAGYFQMTWDGRNNNGSLTASGVYFYRLETVDYKKALKMVILR